MYAYLTYFVFTTLTYIVFGCNHYHDPTCQDVNPIDGDHFINQFIAEIEGGEEVAKNVARDIGFEYKKPMKTHKNHYFFTHAEVYGRHKNRHVDVLETLRKHDDVKVADQQYVWHPTIAELESYEDMVGLEEALEVKTSHFHPDEVEIEGRSAWELIRPDDVFIEPEPIQDYPPIHTLVDFDKLYAEKNREKEKRAQERRLQEALEKRLEEEKRTVATSVTSDSDTDPHDQKSDKVEKPESDIDEKVLGNESETDPHDQKNDNVEKPESDIDEKVLGSEKIDENEKPEKVAQSEKIDDEVKPESIDDEKVAEDEKIGKGEKLESVNGEVLKNEKIVEGELESTGDRKVLENLKIVTKKASPEIGETITEISGINEARTVEVDDEATVETYED